MRPILSLGLCAIVIGLGITICTQSSAQLPPEPPPPPPDVVVCDDCDPVDENHERTYEDLTDAAEDSVMTTGQYEGSIWITNSNNGGWAHYNWVWAGGEFYFQYLNGFVGECNFLQVCVHRPAQPPGGGSL